MMKYTIFTADTAQSLEYQVNSSIELGWQPIGGVSVAAWAMHGCEKTYFEYTQALVKKDERDEECKKIT